MKISLDQITNNSCPQTLFLYGTYKDDGKPNFGLFCWFSYCFDDELTVMACIGGEKMTKDMIRKKGVFSANLVTEELLPLADYLGNKEGYDADKMDIDIDIQKGAVLDVPVLEKSPWTFELEVKDTIKRDDSDIFICKVRNILVEEKLALDHGNPQSVERVKPIISIGNTYFSVGKPIAEWGSWKK